MKKLITILLSAMLFVSLSASAQYFAPGSVSKIDTTTKPIALKFAINKIDSQLVYWNKYYWSNVMTALNDSATIDFGQATATTVTDVTKTVNGAKLGDEVIVGVPHAAVTATGIYTAWVSAANTITIRYSPKATENPASGVFHYTVFKRQKFH